MKANSSIERARLWLRIARAPESWPLELLFILVLTMLFRIVFQGEGLVTDLGWGWQAVKTAFGSPIVLVALLVFAPSIFFRGVGRIIAAGNAQRKAEALRAPEVEAERARAVQEINAALEQSLASIGGRLDELYDEALVVPRLLAQQRRIRENAQQVNEILTRANNTLHSYRSALDQVRGGLRMGAEQMTGHVRNQLRSTIEVLHEAGTALGEQLQVPETEDPEPKIRNPGEDGGFRFAPADNEPFIGAHESNAKLLEGEVRPLQSIVEARAAEYAQLETRIAEHLSKP